MRIPGTARAQDAERSRFFVSSETMKPRILLVLWLAFVMLHTAVAAEWDVGRLMHTLSLTKGGRATFIEKKFIGMLDKPVESFGELLFVAPDRLEKHTLKPQPESMVLDHGTLTIERGEQRHTLRLQDYPEVAAFIDSIRGTLAGDRAALERWYHLSLDGSPERWSLALLPFDAQMAASILRISISGAGDQVRLVEIQQADGDRSVMTIEPAATQ